MTLSLKLRWKPYTLTLAVGTSWFWKPWKMGSMDDTDWDSWTAGCVRLYWLCFEARLHKRLIWVRS